MLTVVCILVCILRWVWRKVIRRKCGCHFRLQSGSYLTVFHVAVKAHRSLPIRMYAVCTDLLCVYVSTGDPVRDIEAMEIVRF